MELLSPACTCTWPTGNGGSQQQLVDSSTLIAGAEALAVLNGCLLVHEAGHLLAAKLFGVAVDEFSVGLGPRLLTYQVRLSRPRTPYIP